MKQKLSLTEKVKLNQSIELKKNFEELFKNGDDWITLSDPIYTCNSTNESLILELLKERYPEDTFEKKYDFGIYLVYKGFKKEFRWFWQKGLTFEQGPLYTKLKNIEMEKIKFYIDKITPEQEDNISSGPILIVPTSIERGWVIFCLNEKYPNDNFKVQYHNTDTDNYYYYVHFTFK